MQIHDYLKLWGKETEASGIGWIDEAVGICKLESAWNYLTASNQVDGIDRKDALTMLHGCLLEIQLQKESRQVQYG